MKITTKRIEKIARLRNEDIEKTKKYIFNMAKFTEDGETTEEKITIVSCRILDILKDKEELYRNLSYRIKDD